MRQLNGALMRSGGVVKALGMKDLFSDAGELLVGSTEFVNGVEQAELRLQEPLDSSDLGESSTFRELRAVEIALLTRGQSLRGQKVRWNCDSQSAVTILKVGSMKPKCHMVAKRIWQLVRQFDMTFECVWQPRESSQIQICDNLSKQFDLSDYKLSSTRFQIFGSEIWSFLHRCFCISVFTFVSTIFCKVLVQGCCSCGCFHCGLVISPEWLVSSSSVDGNQCIKESTGYESKGCIVCTSLGNC